MFRNKAKYPIIPIVVAALLFLGISSCISSRTLQPQYTFTLKILHVNDTHSHVDPEEWQVKIDDKDTKLQLGGFARLMSAVQEELRNQENTLFLHAGDAFQGTLYFVCYEGAADRDFLNLLKIDAMAIGNHEYDKGPKLLAGFIKDVHFPVISANTRIAPGNELAGKFFPYCIKEIGGQKIGIIGLTTPDTVHLSSPGTQVTFTDPFAAADKYCRELAGRGINKIIILSHLGFETDRQLAKTVNGIDIIVGGHSHTLLGDFSRYGINSLNQYPWIERSPDGSNVLIVQAWEWAKVLGNITVSFDENGKIFSYAGTPQLIIGKSFKQRWKDTNGDGRIDAKDLYSDVTPQNAPEQYKGIVNFIEKDGKTKLYEDEQEAKILRDKYAQGIEKLERIVAAVAEESLTGWGNDAGTGSLVADGMLWQTQSFGTVIAIENVGALRGEITKGNITVGQIYELLPFRNTLVVIDLGAAEIKNVLEEALEKSIEKMGYGAGKYVYISGLRCRVDLSKPKGERISHIEVKIGGSYQPLRQNDKYKVVTNSFLAAGGDNFNTFKMAASKEDTGFIDAEVFLEYAKQMKTLKNSAEQRVMLEEAP